MHIRRENNHSIEIKIIKSRISHAVTTIFPVYDLFVNELTVNVA